MQLRFADIEEPVWHADIVCANLSPLRNQRCERSGTPRRAAVCKPVTPWLAAALLIAAQLG
jgi:hypothetical protein